MHAGMYCETFPNYIQKIYLRNSIYIDKTTAAVTFNFIRLTLKIEIFKKKEKNLLMVKRK